MAGNVLFITVDQWRGECLSAAGHPVVETALDRLAASGVRFANH
jgi:arylsulfatase A-like enzyme